MGGSCLPSEMECFRRQMLRRLNEMIAAWPPDCCTGVFSKLRLCPEGIDLDRLASFTYYAHWRRNFLEQLVFFFFFLVTYLLFSSMAEDITTRIRRAEKMQTIPRTAGSKTMIRKQYVLELDNCVLVIFRDFMYLSVWNLMLLIIR